MASQKKLASKDLSQEQCVSVLRWALLGGVPSLQARGLTEAESTLSAISFDHGQSNPTYLITVTSTNYGEESKGFKFVLRSRPRGKLLKSAHLIDREFKVLSILQATAVPVPRVYGYCEHSNLIGSSFYAMEYLPGRIFKDVSLGDVSSARERADIYMEAMRILLLLRKLDARYLQLEDLSRSSSQWIDRQISTWYRQYRASILLGVDYSPIEALHKRLVDIRKSNSEGEQSKWLRKPEHGLVHGDFRLDNLVFHSTKPVCIGVLDWELVSVGNPIADLASFLSPFQMPEKAARSETLKYFALREPRPPGIPTLDFLVNEYVRKSKADVKRIRDELNLYLAVALFRFAAILYGVQSRAAQGNASSTRAAEIGNHAHYFASAANGLLDKPVQFIHMPEGNEIRSFPSMSLVERISSFMEQEVLPLEPNYLTHANSDTRWNPWPELEVLKRRARDANLWNFFLPKNLGGKLSASQYAPIAEITGQCMYAAEVFNCSAPDTGNMELLARFGTSQQREKWLKPLMNGEMRSCFAMTEPAVASSDATNIATKIQKSELGYTVTGRKWWISGAMDKRCKLILLLGRGPSLSESKHHQHSIILIPMQSPGVNVIRFLSVFGYDDSPHGHAELEFDSVIVPLSCLLHKEGGGFEAAQSRLGGGRLHHCMRMVGLAERAIKLMVERAKKRTTFGQQLSQNESVIQTIGYCRCDIDTMRSLVRSAAQAVDDGNTRIARLAVGVAKVSVPKLTLQVVDRAIQLHGGMGVCQDTPLALMYAHTRTLQLADGPDEVHRRAIGRAEIKSKL